MKSFKNHLNEKIEGLVKKSQQTGVPYGILKKSYDRGLAAWRTGHRHGASQHQWAMARVNSASPSKPWACVKKSKAKKKK